MKIKAVQFGRLKARRGVSVPGTGERIAVDEMLRYDIAFQFTEDPTLIAFPKLVANAKITITDERWRSFGYEVARLPAGTSHNFDLDAEKWRSVRWLNRYTDRISYTLRDVLEAKDLRALGETLEKRYEDAQNKEQPCLDPKS